MGCMGCLSIMALGLTSAVVGLARI
jgi:hypothetical protein